jgi:alkylhydroperoxidase/carboxymuconolactone decarboxylase family protein YurZ
MSPTIARRSGARAREQKTPRSWQRFAERYPTVAAAYDTLSDACRHAGPLDEKSVALAKLAVSVGGSIDRSVHIHAKKALRAGVSPDALVQVAVIAMPAIGLARALDALGWIDESIEEARMEGAATPAPRDGPEQTP